MHVNQPESKYQVKPFPEKALEEEMGIRGLTRLLCSNAPDAMKYIDNGISHYAGKRIAFDASLFIYQVMTVASGDDQGSANGPWSNIVSRLSRLLEARVQPVFVFDGNPPVAKAAVLTKRRETASVQKSYRLTSKDVKACKRLLSSIGVPYVEAPSEAEAQCARMCMDGMVYGVATEDMDALAFGTPLLIRNIFGGSAIAGASPLQKHCIAEIHLEKAITGLGLETMEQFVDMCIMCGCDYAGTIPGIGPVRALKALREHGSIDGVLATSLPMTGGRVTHDRLKTFTYQEARKLFLNPAVIPSKDMNLQSVTPDFKELEAFLTEDVGITDNKKAKRIVTKVRKAMGHVNTPGSATPSPCSATPSPSPQPTIESFFGRKKA